MQNSLGGLGPRQYAKPIGPKRPAGNPAFRLKQQAVPQADKPAPVAAEKHKFSFSTMRPSSGRAGRMDVPRVITEAYNVAQNPGKKSDFFAGLNPKIEEAQRQHDIAKSRFNRQNTSLSARKYSRAMNNLTYLQRAKEIAGR